MSHPTKQIPKNTVHTDQDIKTAQAPTNKSTNKHANNRKHAAKKKTNKTNNKKRVSASD